MNENHPCKGENAIYIPLPNWRAKTSDIFGSRYKIKCMPCSGSLSLRCLGNSPRISRWNKSSDLNNIDGHYLRVLGAVLHVSTDNLIKNLVSSQAGMGLVQLRGLRSDRFRDRDSSVPWKT